MSVSETVLANAQLVLSHEMVRGSLLLKEGSIAGIDLGAHVPAGAIDCAGDLVLPGLIELHTDNLERHLQPRPKVHWPHACAIVAHDAELASVGITTVFDALRVGSILEDGTSTYERYARALASEILELRGSGALRISHFLHLRAEICSETLLEELAQFGPEDRVGIVSLMDHTPGQRQFTNLDALRRYVKGKHGLTEEQFIRHVEYQRDLSRRLGTEHEKAAVAAARSFGATLASHDDSTAEQVATSAAHGVHFAEFPTTEEAAQACHRHGIRVMMGAPNLIRGGSHSGNVAAHVLAETGHLDILSSDYVPSSLLAAALQLGDLWGNVPRGVATVTEAPATAVGLTDRGKLEIGLRADVIRVRRVGTTGVLHGAWARGQRIA